jgi:succinoglycan biosynthesis transport protein ExoP
VVQRVPGLQLDYLPACRRPVDPLPLFADERMPRLLRQLRESYDCVVIDSPPLLSVTEARLLAAMVDKVVFVVKWGSTRRDDAQNALNLLRNTGLPGHDRVALAGVVVTQADPKKHARYRYYGDIGDSVGTHDMAKVGTAIRRDAALFRDDHEHSG